jgi:hypothetical protein
MRLNGISGLLAISLCAAGPISGPSREKGRPVSADIVSAAGRVAEERHPGNVRVTLTNGRHEMWTRKGNCELPRVSSAGLVGWTTGTVFHSKGALMNDTLIIARGDKLRARIPTYYPFIDVWDFADRDSCVVVLSRGPHGPGRIEKFRIADGKLLGGCFEGHVDEHLDWANRFLQKLRTEGTYVE